MGRMPWILVACLSWTWAVGFSSAEAAEKVVMRVPGGRFLRATEGV
jgi:hypothetical protein